MSIKNTSVFSLRTLCSGGVAFGVGLFSPAVSAQQSTDGAQTLQRIEVTGSSIRRVDGESSSPVQVITADDLKKTGYSSIAQVLQNLTSNGQGTLSQSFTGAFAAGASAISLRGLTTGATLVLIDGHRIAPYALSDDARTAIVDISNIPFDAIERVEVLKDGASAIYGSDAMAGVVNIILKKSFQGTSVAAETGRTTAGGGATTHASLTHGFGDLANDGYNAYASLEYRQQDRISYGQRKGAGDWQRVDWSQVGGVNNTRGVVTAQSPQPATLNSPYLTNPNADFSAASSYFYPGPCNYALLQSGGCAYQNSLGGISPETKNLNVIGSFTKQLTNGWKLDLKGSMFQSKAEQYYGFLQTFPTSASPLVAISAGVLPRLVGSTIASITVPANYPGNRLGVEANINGVIPGAPIPHAETDAKAYRFVADLSGAIADWEVDATIGYTKSQTTQTSYTAINVPAFNSAINRPTSPYLITGNNTAADMAAIFPTLTATATSILQFAELHATRSLMTLAGGDLAFSAGVSYIQRKLDSAAPSLVANGIVIGNNAYAQGSQTNTSVYAEMLAPVMKNLEFNAAVRFDHFDTAGNATTPKIGFKFTPMRSLALRGTYSTGFRAPNTAENGQAGTAYLAGNSSDPVLCPGGIPASGNPARGSVIAACNYPAVVLNAANPNLQPEKSKSATLGMVFEPIKGWSTTLDLYQIEISKQIVFGTPSDTPVRAPQPVQTLCADGNGGSFTCTPSVGSVLYSPALFVNANSTKARGFEIDMHYKFKMGDAGNLLTRLNWSHTASYVLTTGGVAYQLAGTHGPFIVGGNTGNPKDRVQLTLTYDKGPLDITTAFNWIGKFSLTDPSFGLNDCAAGASAGQFFPAGNVPNKYCEVKAFLSTDLTLRYRFNKKLTLNASVANLFNAQPPVDLNTYGGGQLPYNPSMHSAGATGRFFNIGASYNF